MEKQTSRQTVPRTLIANTRGFNLVELLVPIAMAGILIAASGCGDKRKSVAPVSGIVTLDGKPLAGGSVIFQPAAAPGSTIAGKGSTAGCDDQGRYTLTTIDGQPGAIVAEHRVRIYGPKNQKRPEDDSGIGETASRDIVPLKYNYDTTLSFTVTSEGTDKADFTLTTK
jgi:hypothetical protein